MRRKPNSPHGWIIVVKSDGITTCTPFDPEHSLKQLQSGVGGYIELVTMRGSMSRFDGFCNDEGKLQGLPVNGVISSLYGRDLVCGDVVICNHDAYGETIGLTDEEADEVIDTLKAAGAKVEVAHV